MILFLALTGCQNFSGPAGPGSGVTGTAAVDEMSSIVVETTISGALEDCNVYGFVDGEEIGTALTGFPMKVPAQTEISILAGDKNVLDCENRPLHQDADGLLWTYESTTVTSPAKNESLTVELPFNRFLRGSYICTTESWWYNPDSGEYDTFDETEEFDPLQVTVHDGSRIETNDGNAIANLGGSGYFHVVNSELALDAESDEFVEASWIEEKTFWFRYFLEAFQMVEVTCHMTEEITCQE